MMRYGNVTLTAFCVVIIGSIQSASAQTSYGNSGLFVHPTATRNPIQHITLNVSYLNIPSSSTNPESHWVPVNITIPAGQRAQWGATYVNKVTHRTSFGSAGLFGKYELLSETENRPALAIATNFLGGDIKLISASLAASKNFKQSGRTLATVHIGGQYVHWKDDDTDTGDTRPYVGTNIPITKRFDIVGELGSKLKFDNAATSSLGILYHDGPRMSIGTGYVNNGRSRRGGFFFGIGRPIGGD